MVKDYLYHLKTEQLPRHKTMKVIAILKRLSNHRRTLTAIDKIKIKIDLRILD